MDIEIGYDEDIFNPLSITFNNSNKVVENYQTVSNLLSKDRTIKTVTWAIEEPQIVEGKIGEVSLNWNNNKKSGKIWLKYFQINDETELYLSVFIIDVLKVIKWGLNTSSSYPISISIPSIKVGSEIIIGKVITGV
jgi:hypothetical protein